MTLLFEVITFQIIGKIPLLANFPIDIEGFAIQWKYSITFAPAAFRSFEPQIEEPFPNEQLLRKKKIAAAEQTIFHWKTAVRFTV